MFTCYSFLQEKDEVKEEKVEKSSHQIKEDHDKDSILTKKPKYEKHMLIFGDRELEIICVDLERSRWIVRNEQELFELVR